MPWDAALRTWHWSVFDQLGYSCGFCLCFFCFDSEKVEEKFVLTEAKSQSLSLDKTCLFAGESWCSKPLPGHCRLWLMLEEKTIHSQVKWILRGFSVTERATLSGWLVCTKRAVLILLGLTAVALCLHHGNKWHPAGPKLWEGPFGNIFALKLSYFLTETLKRKTIWIVPTCLASVLPSLLAEVFSVGLTVAQPINVLKGALLLA